MTAALLCVPALFAPEMAAAYLGVSPRKLAEYQAAGRIIPRDLDGRRMFHRDDLDQFAASLPDWEGRK